MLRAATGALLATMLSAGCVENATIAAEPGKRFTWSLGYAVGGGASCDLGSDAGCVRANVIEYAFTFTAPARIQRSWDVGASLSPAEPIGTVREPISSQAEGRFDLTVTLRDEQA